MTGRKKKGCIKKRLANISAEGEWNGSKMVAKGWKGGGGVRMGFYPKKTKDG